MGHIINLHFLFLLFRSGSDDLQDAPWDANEAVTTFLWRRKTLHYSSWWPGLLLVNIVVVVACC